jgi:hypothetical protein
MPHWVGPKMSCWSLPISCHVISCTTVQRLTLLVQQQILYKERCHHFDMTLNENLRDSNHATLQNSNDQPHVWENVDFFKGQAFLCEQGKILALDDPTIPEADKQPISTLDSFDPYVNMKLSLPRGQDNTIDSACGFETQEGQ